MTQITVSVKKDGSCYTYEELMPNTVRNDERMSELIAKGILYENGWCLNDRITWDFQVEP